MSAVGRFLQQRPRAVVVVALLALLAGGLGAVFAGFEISHRKLPTYEIWRRADRIVEAACCLKAPAATPPATYASGLIKLVSDVRPVKLDIQRSSSNLADFSPMSFSGGGMVSFGDDLLLLPYDGKLYAARPGEDARVTRVRAPDTYREAFQALAKDPAYKDYSFELRYVRYNDLAFFDGPGGRGLLASYVEFDAEEVCFRNAVARLDIATAATSIDEVAANPDDWRVIYRANPCLPLKKRWSALEGQMGGGRLAMIDATTVILTTGDFHFDGMRSDGLGIAQDPSADYGKTLAIDINSGASRVFSSGHRNPQGMAIDGNGEIYVVEHGPKGGDELNHIVEGRNYGWPKESLGITYDNKKLPEATAFGRHEEFESPVFAWMPSPALASLIYVKPGFHPAWDGDLLAGSLIEQSLHRVRFTGGRPVYSETIPVRARVRSLHQHTNGQIVLWTDSHELIWLRAEELSSNESVLKEFIASTRIDESTAVKLEAAVTRCAECHSFEVGDSVRAPSLARIYDDPVASTGYPGYSEALKARREHWTKTNLAKFLADPQAFAPGTMMPPVANSDPRVINSVVDYLVFYDKSF
jgi:aldose sugar dehydrogenase